MIPAIPRSIVLNICAASSFSFNDGALLICGLPPGHHGDHHDACWPIAWSSPRDATVSFIPRQRDQEVDTTDP